MIILVASLIVSGIAGIVLIEAWTDVATANENMVKSRAADVETQVAFAGDPAMVPLDTSGGAGNYKLTFVIQNTGSRNIDYEGTAIFVDGIPFGDGSDQLQSDGTALPASFVWGPGDLMIYEVTETASNEFAAYVDETTVTLTIVVESVTINGHSGTDSETYEVRLDD